MQRLLLCIAFCLSLSAEALCLDAKVSKALTNYIIAGFYEAQGQTDAAIQEYKRALRIDPDNPAIHVDLAVNYIRNNDSAKAIEELNLSVKLDPAAVEPHTLLALLYSSLNKTEEANKEYEIALRNASKLQPENIEIYNILGVIYLRQNKLKEAQGTFELILKLAPGNAAAHFYLATIYDEQKLRPQAVEELKQAIAINPDYAEALNYLGYVYVEENKNLDQAQILIQKALEIDPDNGAYIDSLGWLYFKQGKYSEALAELKRAKSLLDDPVIYDHLGDAYFQLNDFENAKISWQRSLELDPKQDKVKNKIEEIDAVQRKAD